MILKALKKLINEALVDLDSSIRRDYKTLARKGISRQEILDRLSLKWDLPVSEIEKMLKFYPTYRRANIKLKNLKTAER